MVKKVLKINEAVVLQLPDRTRIDISFFGLFLIERTVGRTWWIAAASLAAFAFWLGVIGWF